MAPVIALAGEMRCFMSLYFFEQPLPYGVPSGPGSDRRLLLRSAPRQSRSAPQPSEAVKKSYEPLMNADKIRVFIGVNRRSSAAIYSLSRSNGAVSRCVSEILNAIL
jgi:hypothetical protein